jgi:hypothetical protein
MAVIVGALWQWVTVTANYGGNWTALFFTGATQKHPALVASEHIYLFANSTGYDGQMYHYVAHDPWMRSDLKLYVDNPLLRYRRVFIPLIAYCLALGQTGLIDRAYELVCLLSIGLGVYWSCRLALSVKSAPAFGLLFLLMPATLVTLDRLVIDGGLAALTAAFLYYSRSPSWRLFVVLVCATLTRETGFLLLLAYCAYLAWRREFRMTGIFLLSAVPAVAWYSYVRAQSGNIPSGFTLVPLSSIVQALAHPWPYPAGVPFVNAVHAADFLALLGMLLAFAIAFRWFARRPSDPWCIVSIPFVAMALALYIPYHWQNVYDYGRVYTPVLLCLAALSARHRRPWLLTPVAMILPRVAIQLTPQLIGVVRWLSA